MDNSLLSLVSRFLTPDMIARLAAALGLDRSVIGKLVAAAAPTILAGLGNVAATPGGAKRIADVVSAQPPGALESLAGSLGGAGQSSMLAEGSRMLGSLLGGDSVSALAGVVGAQAGVDGRAATSVLGFLAPVVMGALRQQNVSDAGGVAQLFAEQKGAIAAAMPSGLAAALGSAGLMKVSGAGGALRDAATQGLANAAGSARGAATDAADAARRSAGHAAHSASQAASRVAAGASSGIPMWVWALVAIASAAIVWTMFGGPGVEQAANKAPATQAGQAASQSAQGAAGAVVQAGGAAADATRQATTLISGLATALGSITDATSAAAALPKLRETVGGVDKLADLVNGLPADARKTVAAPVAAALPGLRQLIEKALALPGVGDIVRPVVEPALAKLDALARA